MGHIMRAQIGERTNPDSAPWCTAVIPTARPSRVPEAFAERSIPMNVGPDHMHARLLYCAPRRVTWTRSRHFLPETVYIQRQHSRVQDQDRPQSAEASVADESEIAGNREGAKRHHTLRVERSENQTGSEISDGSDGRHRIISPGDFQIKICGGLSSHRTFGEPVRPALSADPRL